MKKISSIAFLLLVTVVSCTKQNPDDADTSDEIRFVTSIETKVSATAFEQGDMVSVWAVEQGGAEKMPLQIGGNYINNERLTLGAGGWTASRTLYWSEKPCDFYALYPYREISSVKSMVFSLPTDQNTAASEGTLSGYEQADVMYAYSENESKSEAGVSLNFHHMLAKCSVNIVKGPTFEGVIPDDIIVHIYNTTIDYTLNMLQGSVGVYPFGVRKTITMHKDDNEHFRAIVVPQNIELDTPLIEVTMGGIAYLLNYSMSFKPGYNHTLTLTLNTSPDQEQIEISIDPGVNPWQ